jgi:hypothetical protein
MQFFDVANAWSASAGAATLSVKARVIKERFIVTLSSIRGWFESL